MKNVVPLITAVLMGLAGVCGCRSETEITDSPSRKPDVSAEVLSASSLRRAAGRAVTEILSSDDFQSYVQRHKTASGNVPLMKVARFRNDTDTPDLDVETVITPITETLLKAGRVRVFDRNAAREAAMRNNLENDEHYNVKRTVMEAPQLLLDCRISLQKDRIKSKKEITAVLSVQISDLKTGQVVVLKSVSWGVTQSRGRLGL